MSNDYTQSPSGLPPVPDAQVTELGVKLYFYHQMRRYGHACAEAARAPLAEENARLKARLRSVCQSLVAAVGADGPCDAEDAAVRPVARIAELEAEVSAQIERADRHENRGKELSVENIRLRAEVEALTADNAAMRADAERWRWIETPGKASVYVHGGPSIKTLFACNGRLKEFIDSAISRSK